MSNPTMHLRPDALFVIACPICQGQVAAAGSVCGRDACCPLCASLFRVPFPPAPAAESPEPDTSQSGSLGEDWEGVIEQLAPPRRETDAGDRREPAGTFAPVETEPSAPTPEPFAPTPEPFAPTPEPFAPTPELPAPTPELPVATEPSCTIEPSLVTVEPAAASEPLPALGSPPAEPAPGELRFKEPVRTVRVGGEVIEIRRLSPEERRRRRVRRNLVMIVVGVSILLAIVILAGFPPRRP